MAILLYSNGITEEYKAGNLTFNEEELISIFHEFPKIKSVRIPSMKNTWCIYGVGNDDPIEFNKMAVVLLQSQSAIYSHLLFIHDSELNPEWKVSDEIIYNSYADFLLALTKFINDAADRVLNEITSTEEYENKVDYLPQLTTLGATADKKIIFVYNPDEQSNTFYNNDEFYKFSQKVYEYIIKNKQYKEPFTIYEDKKAVIVIENGKVQTFFNTLLEKFKSKEDYEICTNLTKMMKEWSSTNEPVKKKRAGRKPRSKNSSDEQ